jgi:Asp-tRNA(Asn)/Glu-tRNA(Gln) amidotransferase A subunit family amidase
VSIFEAYDQYDATGLAGLIARGEISARTIIDTAIARIEARNPALNAVVTPLYEQALGAVTAGLPPGPLRGVPYLVKDLNTWIGGVPATNGSRAFRTFCPDDDGVLVKRLRAGGLVILGKTNTPEFGLNICTSPALFGPTLNPFDATRSAGGSSGGSASAVASGMLPAAHATDSGGSIRIPASNCGLFGLKPSRARVPLGNDQAEGMAGFSTAHAVTHSVRDSALLLDIASGPMPGDAYAAPAQTGRFVDCLDGAFPALRIALWTEGFAGEAVAQSCKQAARDAAQLCAELGCTVEEAGPDIDGIALRKAFDVLFTGNICNLLGIIASANPGERLETLVEPVTYACARAGRGYSAADYAAAVMATQQASRLLGQFFTRFDVLLTPTLANPPLPLGAITMQTDDWPGYVGQLLDELPFTPLFNATGAPAASLPLGRTVDGLPLGVHIGAALGGEATLLRLARELERAAPWHHRQ